MTDHRLPVAPVALISALSAYARLPTIIDCRVGRDSSVMLEVLASPEVSITADTLLALAHTLGCNPEDIEIIPGTENPATFIVFASRSEYDFTPQFAAQEAAASPAPELPGTDDSEESIEASEALLRQRNPSSLPS